ncbi:1259_t:CDS:2, partial [Gigaspora margarita]
VPFNMQILNNFSEPSGQLPVNIIAILLPNYNYIASEVQQLSDYITPEGFSINQFKATFFVNVSNIEDSQKWFNEYEEASKTTMPETKGFQIQGKKVIFRELHHSTIHLRIERWRLQTTHPLEVNINFVHNHIIHCAKSLSFRRIKEEVRNKYLELFTNGHSPATALHIYEDNLYLSASDDQELIELLADRAQNPDYAY